MSTGRLLDKVAYCSRPKSKGTNIIGVKIDIIDTFPYNPDSKTAPETAKRWAQNYYARGQKERPEPEVIVRVNAPFTLTIIDLEHRSQGGRAYKVIDVEHRCFDLREDQVVEVMKKVGIMPMGVVPGTFVWGIVGSQVKLVLVDGDLHKELVKGSNEAKAYLDAQKLGLTPTEGTLQSGHVYRKKDKSLHLFLGKLRREGVNKTFYAFMEMPGTPVSDLDEASIDETPNCGRSDEGHAHWKVCQKRMLDIQRRWDTLTWREKCNFAWDESYNMYCPDAEKKYYFYENIVLMSSPKFEVDVGTVEDDFFQELKANKGHRHQYVGGNRNSILHEEFKKAGYGARGYLTDQDTWVAYGMYGRDQVIENRVTEIWRKMKEDFYRGLTWL